MVRRSYPTPVAQISPQSLPPENISTYFILPPRRCADTAWMTQAQTHAHEEVLAPRRPVRKRSMAVLRAFAMLVSILASILRRLSLVPVRASLLECHTDADTLPAPQVSRDNQETDRAEPHGQTSPHPLTSAHAGAQTQHAGRFSWLPPCPGMSGERSESQKDLSSRTCAACAGIHSSTSGLLDPGLPALRRSARPAGMTARMILHMRAQTQTAPA
jgi:hypothetical protein